MENSNQGSVTGFQKWIGKIAGKISDNQIILILDYLDCK